MVENSLYTRIYQPESGLEGETVSYVRGPLLTPGPTDNVAFRILMELTPVPSFSMRSMLCDILETDTKLCSVIAEYAYVDVP